MLLGIVGGALLQWPAGHLSDRTDRRWVIVGMGTATAVAAFVLTAVGTPGWLFFALVLVFGGAMLPLYPLFNAHVNDYLEPRQFVGAGSAMIFLQGIGAIAGPLLAGWLMGAFAPAAFLWYVGAMHAAMVAFTLYRLARRGRGRGRRHAVRYHPAPAHSPATVLWPGDPGRGKGAGSG